MTDDSAAILDDLLCRWSQWCRPPTVGRGHNRSALVLGQYRASRQYDAENGALDEDVEHATMKVVDFEVSEMDDPYKAAIYVQARALVIGCTVFMSPRLPSDPDQRAAVILQARMMLVTRLMRAGVM